jgi:hypothetical protein
MEVRKFAAQWFPLTFAALLLAAPAARAQQPYVHHETNASREARIQRTIHDTYSHRWEVVGGGGFLRFRSGETTQKNNEVSWAVAVNRYLNPKLAIVGDARGSFGNGKVSQAEPYIQYNSESPRPQINEYTFTGGLSYRFYAKEKLALSVQGLGGMGWGIFSGGARGLSYQYTGFWQDGIRPAFIGNISADYNFFPNLAFRVSPTYVGTTFGGSVQNNLGVNAGFVYRFGRQ